jgi:carboxyl-terminal processing protease
MIYIYNKSYQIGEPAFAKFIEYCKQQGANPSNPNDVIRSKNFIKLQLKALIARQIWREKGYYNVVSKQDKGVLKALEAFNNYNHLIYKK